MIKSASGYLRLLLSCSVLIYGCSKSLTNLDPVASNASPRLPAAYFITDPGKSPFYGDSVLYVQGSGPSASLFKPVNELGAGRYVSWPAGLSIDEQSGVIDASRSEPGSRYNVGFVDAVTKDTSYNQVILGGVTYPDGIYYMDSESSELQPYYNASSSAPWIVNSKGINPGLFGNNSLFDEQGPSGLRANDLQLRVNTGSGVIDLKNSFQAGLFGNDPQNGDVKQIAIYYRLDNSSKMSLQKTTVILHYYNTLSDVPAELISICQASQNAFGLTQPDGSNNGSFSQKAVTASSAEVKASTTTAPPPAKPVPVPVVPRPPQIVIVNKGH
jgi:hypothetical protein